MLSSLQLRICAIAYIIAMESPPVEILQQGLDLHVERWQSMTDQTDHLVQFKAEFFKALASPLRIKILDELRQGEVSVSELRMRLGVEATNLSQQLAILKAKNLVSVRKQSSKVYYSCRDTSIFNLLEAAKDIFNNHLIDVKDMLEAL
jgi:ArsR family transcriptional regulator